MPTDELLIKLLGAVRLFAGMGRQDLVNLLACAEKVNFAAGEYVFSEGEEGQSVYVVVAGAVEVLRATPDGHGARLATLHPGDSFGEMALIDKHPRSASVRATSACVTLRFPKEKLDRYPAVAMQLYQNIARLLARRLRQANDVILLHTESGGSSPHARHGNVVRR